jgi:hypothetical protein
VSRIRIRLFVVLATFASILTVSPLSLAHAQEESPTAASGGPNFGVQFHATWGDYSDAQRLEVLDKLAAANVKWVRVDMGWASFQESSRSSYTQYHVDKADWIVNQARARGINVLGMLWRTPDWANNGAGTATPPSDPDDYGRIARWAAEHFKGRVAAWEVWNEPNLDYFFNGTPADYVKLLKASYSQFKAGDPNTKVVLGGPSYNDTDWLEKVYAAGAQGYFDVMATHPYQGVADAAPEKRDDGTIWTLSHVAAVRDLMQKNGDGDKKIWFTEFGWSSHANQGNEPNWRRGVTPEQQGDYLVRSIKYVRENFPYVTHMFWYNERNRDTGDVQLDNYGLMHRDLKPKPAYTALKDYLTGSAPAPSPAPTSTPTPVAPKPTSTPTPASTSTPAAPKPTSTPTPPATTPPAPAPTGTPSSPPAPAPTNTPASPAPEATDGTESPDPAPSATTPDGSEPTPSPTSTTPPPEPTAEPVADKKPGNMLQNASFERGRSRWKTKGGGLSTIRIARSGYRAAKLRQRRPVARVVSHPIRVAGGRVVAGGYFRATRGRRVQLVVVERKHGKIVGRQVRRARATGQWWQPLPQLRYGLRAQGSKISLKLKALGRRGDTLIDDLFVRRPVR